MTDEKPGNVPRELINFFERKKLRPAWSYTEVWGDEHKIAFTAAKVMEADLLADIRDAVVRAQNEGLPFAAFRKELEPILAAKGWWGQLGLEGENKGAARARRLQTIYDTNLRQARRHGQYDRTQRRAKVQPFLRWRLGPSHDHRPEHVAFDGLIYPADHVFWKTHFPPTAYGCFAPGTQVRGEIQGASKAWYAGQAVEIETKAGRRVTVTVNHPVATARGWLAAGDLREGDHLFPDSPEIERVLFPGPPHAAGGAVGDQQVPPLAEQVFDTAVAQGPSGLVSATPLDFHGEAQRFVGQVHVVGAYWELVLQRYWAVRSHLALAVEHAGLSAVAALSHAASLVPGPVPPPASVVRGLEHAFACAVVGIGPALQSSLAPPAFWHTPAPEQGVDGVPVTPLASGERLNGLARQVTTDEIVRIRELELCGHVYDLQSVSGAVWAGGLLMSNCKCWVESLTRRQAEALGGVSPELDKRLFPDQTYRDPRSGKKRTVPYGVDPGFEFTPGISGRTAGVRQALAKKS